MAVSSGSMASTTAPWEAGACCMAIAISSGKPTMEKAANAASRGHSRRAGGTGRAHRRATQDSAAATNERPAVTNSGSSSATATRVAGSVRPKIATPRMPSSRACRAALRLGGSIMRAGSNGRAAGAGSNWVSMRSGAEDLP